MFQIQKVTRERCVVPAYRFAEVDVELDVVELSEKHGFPDQMVQLESAEKLAEFEIARTSATLREP